MRPNIQTALLVILMLAICMMQAHGQAVPTATEELRLSAFGGVTGTFTGLSSGKNVGITAGADVELRPHFSLYPSIEVRGTYPVAKGSVDSQKNILGGLKVAKPVGNRFRPYADFLFGRGEIKYGNGYAIPASGFYYVQSVSNIFSPGVGVDFLLTNRVSLKADAQFQRYSSPVTTSGNLYAKPITFGVVYSFDFNRHPHR